MIPISKVEFGEAEEQLVLEVLRSGNIAQGPLVKRFEDLFAQQIGVRHAIAVNNGTTSLIAALKAFNLSPEDEVITSPFTFVASLNAIIDSGATATFADISESDFGLDPVALSTVISPRTKAIMPVHLYGQMCDLTSITEIANQNSLHILEDSAQAYGASQNGIFAGTTDVGSFSLYATKNLTTGEGGVITTNDDDFADKLRIMRNQGMRQRYRYEMAGNNYRLTDLQAAVGIPQLGRYHENVSSRSENAKTLREGLSGLTGIITPKELPGRKHVWHQFTIRVTAESGISRDELSSKLAEKGVGSGIYYPSMVFDYGTYRSHPRVQIGEYPVAKRISQEVLSLPVHPHLSKKDLHTIVDSVRDIVEAVS
jgi:perosamine synthetase